MAHPELGHAVLHVEVGGIEPGRDYFYHFTIGVSAARGPRQDAASSGRRSGNNCVLALPVPAL